MRTLDLEALQIFRAVAQHGGITKAAARLNRVQSNVTTRVKQLEERLGTELFHRRNRKMMLSPEGKLLLGYAERLLRLSIEAEAALRNGKPHGVFRLGTIESVAATRLPPILSRFHREHPQVQVDLATGTTDVLITKVLDFEIEAAFVAQPFDTDELEMRPAFDEELVLIGPKDFPKVVRPQEIGQRTVIAFSTGCAYRRVLENWLYQAKVVPERILEFASYHTIVACVAAGTGVALVPRSVLYTQRAQDDVNICKVPSSIAKAKAMLIWRRGWRSASLNALMKEMAG
jgi:DNA-binding transcriptional LysR family regulator